jgi:hypothetical protein
MTTKMTGAAVAGACVGWAAIAEDSAIEASMNLAEAGQALAPYLGVCPTCLGWRADGDEVDASCDACPTCGERSVEWSLSCEIDALLREMNALEALDRAVCEL